MQLNNPFERVAFGGLIPQGEEFRRRWRAVPRAERKRLTTLALQTQYALATTFASVVLLVLTFAVISGRGYLAGAAGAFITMPLIYVWQVRKLTAVVAKNIALIERTRQAAASGV